MQVTFYRLSKRINSTKRPSGTGLTLEMLLKEACSEDTPSFTVSAESLLDYNYFVWNGRFYWITEKTYIRNGLYGVTGALDHLATYRPEIMGTTARIQYAQIGDEYIIDSRIPQTMNTTSFITTEHDIPGFSDIGCHVLTVVNDHTGVPSTYEQAENYGVSYSVSPYALGQQLISKSIWDELVKQFTNPMSAILSMVWIPLTTSSIAKGDITNIRIGYNDIGARGWVVKTVYNGTTVDITIPEEYHDYRDAMRQCSIYLPGVGTLPVNLQALTYSATKKPHLPTLHVDYSIDTTNGDISYRITIDDRNTILMTANGNIGVQIPVTSVNYNAVGAISGVGSLVTGAALTVAGAFTEGATIPSGMSMMASGAASTFSSLSQSSQIGGAMGGRSSIRFNNKIVLSIQSKPTTESWQDYTILMGRPFMKVDRIGNHSGYIQTVNASVSIPAEQSHITAVNSMLDGGIYLE